MTDLLLASLFSTLDVVVFQRLPNSVFMQVTPSPPWFVQAFGRASEGEAITLAQAFPFLDAFLSEAQAMWDARRPDVVRSDPFAVTTAEGDILLRAAATTAATRPLLVLERLVGLADPTAFLQTAREKELASERTAKQLAALGGAAAALVIAVEQLKNTELTAAQRELMPALERALDKVRLALDRAGGPA